MADQSFSDPLEPRVLGTLVVVVGKARNLPNKSRFGKQDPFCSVRIGEEKKKTKSIKRGGQHPEWDEELRFTIMEDLEEVLARSESTNALNMSTSSVASGPGVPAKDPSLQGVTTAAALASKSRKGPLGKDKDKASKKMVVTCYADDMKEPDLIGECVVPIDEVLRKGEVDEWYEFLYKEKYSGEVYLELTFYSNDAPPVKRNPSVQKYGQSSVLNSSASISLSSRPSISSLATSSSVAGMNLYIPPYIQPAQQYAQYQQHQQQQGHGTMPPSSSFANLGVPPVGHHNPHGQGASGQMSSAASTSTLHVHDPMDALTRPMSSMSITSIASSASRPLPPASPLPPMQQQPPLQNQTPQTQGSQQQQQHRHSLGEAPWASLLPQNQPLPPSHTPVSRPVSAAEAYGQGQAQSAWDHARLAASTPLARPLSSAYNPPSSAVSINGAYPPSLQAGQLPQQQQQQGYHRHAHSFSGVSAGEPHPSTYLKPATPQPPVPPSSAPPAPYEYVPPQQQQLQQDSWQGASLPPSHSQSHYPLPTSSFPALTASSSTGPYRASTPTPTQPTQTWQPSGGYQPGQAGYGQDGGNATNPYDHRANSPLPPVPHQDHSQSSHGSYQQDPYRATTPTPAQYATQNQYQHPPPPQHQPQPPPQSATAFPASASSYYPPAVPTPPRRQSTPVTSHQHQGYQATPPPQQQANAQGYVPWYQQIRPSASSSVSSIGAAATPPPPPVPDYTRPAPAPPAPPKGGAGYYPSDELYVQHQQHPQPSPQQQQSPYGWQAPGQPPSLPSTGSALEQAIGQRAPLGWQSTVNGAAQGYGQQQQPPRQPSPSPVSYGQAQPAQDFQPYQPPYAPTISGSNPPNPHMASQSNLASHRMSLPGRTPSPLPPAPTGGSGSGPAQPSALKQDWKSYMASLGSSASVPARSPSPLPPPPHQQQQQQQDWYTPPPSVPSSIRPQDGWGGQGQGQGQGQQQ